MSNNKQMSIEKEFVPYEESLELKELGFDEPCFAIYIDKQLQINATYQNHLAFKGWVASPTFSQAFRWFRDNHNLHHEIEYNGYEYLGYVSGMTANIFKTYEEAELACLRKLIEIVQGGNK